jgi:hypothetical protein
MKLRFLISVMALACGSVLAQNAPSNSLDKSITQDKKMVQISDGLYAETSANSESYLAVNPNGQKALLEKLVQIRNKMSMSSAPKTDNNRSSVIVDELISTLSRPQPMLGSISRPQPMAGGVIINDGNCSGQNNGGPFYAQAGAGGGVGGSAVGASSLAQNQDTSASPVYTTNYAHAIVVNRNSDTVGEQTSTQYGTTAAVAAVYPSGACSETASATLTCPGYSAPSVTAYSHANVGSGGGTCTLN